MTNPVTKSKSSPSIRMVQRTGGDAVELDRQIAEIDILDRPDCLERWRSAFGRPPPKHLSLQFMRRVLIWEMQNRALGGVSAKTTRRLRQNASGNAVPSSAKPGSHLVREWNGRTYQVEVVDGGYVMDGKTWRSLSAIARHITGAHWSGHYPLVEEPQDETLNVFISDYNLSRFPSSPSYALLEAELQRSLGANAILPKDPEDKGLYYQYATNGIRYSVAAYLYHPKPYAWDQGPHSHKVEVSNRPDLKTATHRPGYLRHVLKFGPDDPHKQGEFDASLRAHDFEKAKKLIEAGANPSQTCGFNFRCQPLAIAAIDGDLEVMKFLIDHGADVDGFNSYDGVALIFALESLHIEAAKLLISSGANVNIPSAFGFSPFVGAPALGDVDLLKLMVENGAHINENYYVYVGNPEYGEKGPLPLEVAIMYGQPDAVSFLLESGADPSLHTVRGETLRELLRKSDNGAIKMLPP